MEIYWIPILVYYGINMGEIFLTLPSIPCLGSVKPSTQSQRIPKKQIRNSPLRLRAGVTRLEDDLQYIPFCAPAERRHQ